MTVLLRRSDDLPAEGWRLWTAVLAQPRLDPARAVDGLPRLLEEAFDAAAPELLELGRALGADAGAALAHTPACATNVSDLGTVLAWDRLVRRWAGEPETILVVCDDPWLFRHWATGPGVTAGRPPGLARRRLALWARGFAARLAVSLRMARAAFSLKRQRRAVRPGAPALMVYGHPRSKAEGFDAYFGTLMAELPELTRILHVDCPPARALELEGHGRTLSLHAFGSPLAALGLWRARWTPAPAGRLRWLVARAAALEGATGTPAMIAWQLHCQRRWLAAARPRAVAWPWENHAWERVFVREARAAGTATIGYQHATVGRRELNYSPASNPDGAASLPDRLLTVGEADRRRLASWGCPAERLAVGGALRFPAAQAPRHDPAAPVFLALPFDGTIAGEMVEAMRPIAAAGRRVLVKDHPMTPFAFQPSAGLERCTVPLADQAAVAAVVYCITTLGLEALLAGLPTIRFIPASRPVVDVTPDGVVLPAASAGELAAALDQAPPPPRVPREYVFAAPDMALWREVLR